MLTTLLWILVFVIGGMFLYLSAASMMGAFLKSRFADDDSTYDDWGL